MGETAFLRVLVVDAQPVMRDGLRINIEAEPDLRVVAEAGDCPAALIEAARHRPDVVLLDLSLVSDPSGGFIRRLREACGGGRIVVLSSLEEDHLIESARRAGAAAHLPKDAFREELIAAIRTIAPAHAPPVAGTSEAPLSARELDVLRLVAKGKSDAEIGAALGVAETAAKSYVDSILRKTGDPGRIQAAMQALKRGDIQL